MNKGSQNTAPDTSTPAPVVCPEWCVTTAAQHAGDDADSPLHKGPTIGRFTIWFTPAEGFSATLNEGIDDNTDLTEDDLGGVAADALAVAECIEAHR